MAETDDTGRTGSSQAPSGSPPAAGSRQPARLGFLHMVVAWRSILALTAISVATAALLGVAGWPFWDREPPVITVTQPAPKVAAADLETGRRDVDGLRRRIAELEAAVAQKRAACVPTPEPQPPAVQPTPEPPPPKQAQRTLDCEQTCRLCRENRRELTGNVSVSLAWDSYADLDLHLVCPDGSRIKYSNRRACGGELNVDMNVGGTKSREPIENITLTERSPRGKYRIFVEFYKPVIGELTVPFRVSLNLNGQTRTFTGTAVYPQNSNQQILVHEFDLAPEAQASAEGGASFQLKCEECNCRQRASIDVPALIRQSRAAARDWSRIAVSP